MSKSAIYTANTSSNSIATNSNIPLGTTIRRFGCNCYLNGDGINLNGSGYYKVSVNADVAPATAGLVTIMLYKDGVEVAGANASETTTADTNIANLSFNAIVRNCNCSSVITIVLSDSASVVSNIGVVVEKL